VPGVAGGRLRGCPSGRNEYASICALRSLPAGFEATLSGFAYRLKGQRARRTRLPAFQYQGVVTGTQASTHFGRRSPAGNRPAPPPKATGRHNPTPSRLIQRSLDEFAAEAGTGPPRARLGPDVTARNNRHYGKQACGWAVIDGFSAGGPGGGSPSPADRCGVWRTLPTAIAAGQH
jgi:hypothetical protein